MIATDSQIFKKSFLICESVAKKIEAELRGIKPKEIKISATTAKKQNQNYEMDWQKTK